MLQYTRNPKFREASMPKVIAQKIELDLTLDQIVAIMRQLEPQEQKVVWRAIEPPAWSQRLKTRFGVVQQLTDRDRYQRYTERACWEHRDPPQVWSRGIAGGYSTGGVQRRADIIQRRA